MGDGEQEHYLTHTALSRGTIHIDIQELPEWF